MWNFLKYKHDIDKNKKEWLRSHRMSALLVVSNTSCSTNRYLYGLLYDPSD